MSNPRHAAPSRTAVLAGKVALGVVGAPVAMLAVAGPASAVELDSFDVSDNRLAMEADHDSFKAEGNRSELGLPESGDSLDAGSPLDTDFLTGAAGLPGGDAVPTSAALPGPDGLPSSTDMPSADDLPSADALPGSDGLPSADALPGSDGLPSADALPGSDGLPSADGLPGADALPGSDGLPSADALPGLQDLPISDGPGLPGADDLPGSDGPGLPNADELSGTDALPGGSQLPVEFELNMDLHAAGSSDANELPSADLFSASDLVSGLI